MKPITLKDAPLSFRIFTSLLLCVIGLTYLTLLGSIWIDTEMKISHIIEGYGSFEFIELIEHSFKYFFWFVCIFAIIVFLFLLTSYSEKLKRFFAVAVPLLIVSDLSAMWLISYVKAIFAWQLYISGLMLAASFFALFLFIQYDLWLKKD